MDPLDENSIEDPPYLSWFQSSCNILIHTRGQWHYTCSYFKAGAEWLSVWSLAFMSFWWAKVDVIIPSGPTSFRWNSYWFYWISKRPTRFLFLNFRVFPSVTPKMPQMVRLHIPLYNIFYIVIKRIYVVIKHLYPATAILVVPNILNYFYRMNQKLSILLKSFTFVYIMFTEAYVWWKKML